LTRQIKYLLLVLSICFCHFALLAQQNKIDSLISLLKTAKEDTNKVITLNMISWQILNTGDYERALKYGEEAHVLAKEINFKKGIAIAHNNIGLIHFYKGEYDKAVECYSKSLKIAEEMNNKKGMASSNSNLGLIYKNKGEYDKALEYYFKSLKFYEEVQMPGGQVGDKKGIAGAFNNIGIIHYYMGDYTKALEYYGKALPLVEELGDKGGLSVSYVCIGIIHHESKNYEQGLEYYNKALQIQEESGDKKAMTVSFNNIGSLYDDQGNYDKALEYYNKALRIQEQVDDKQGMATSYNNMGNLSLKKRDVKTAKQSLLQSLKISLEINAKPIVKENYLNLSQCDSILGNFKSAYEYHKRYAEVKDSILNEESSKQITEMQTKYETEKKEQQITLLNKDKELQDAQLNRQKIIIWSVAGGLLVVLILSIFIFRERRKSEKLLLNILPAETARELKRNGKATARHYESVTVMFTDFKGFTTIAEKLSAEELVSELDFLFKKFDEIISKYPIEKIKTIGDAYMCASGLPTPNTNHAENIVKAGIEIQTWMKEQNNKWSLRMGIHSGPVTAGVVGDKKFAYDIWGDTVNTASRMESSGEAGKINISGSTHEHVKDKFTCIHRGKISAKNKGEIEMYFVEKV